MSKRKANRKIDHHASCGNDHDTFGYVYSSMLKHPAYIGLPLEAKQGYTLCRNQLHDSASRRILYNHAAETGEKYNDSCFVFPAKCWKEYGITRQQGSRILNTLIDRGFIRRVEQNKHRWQANVYQFCSDWKKTDSRSTNN